MGHIQSSITNELTSSVIMKVMGLFAVTLAVCLVSMTVAQPIVFLDPLTAASFTTAGGLVLPSAAGSTATIPTGALVLGGLAAKKLALLKILEAQQASWQSKLKKLALLKILEAQQQ